MAARRARAGARVCSYGRLRLTVAVSVPPAAMRRGGSSTASEGAAWRSEAVVVAAVAAPRARGLRSSLAVQPPVAPIGCVPKQLRGQEGDVGPGGHGRGPLQRRGGLLSARRVGGRLEQGRGQRMGVSWVEQPPGLAPSKELVVGWKLRGDAGKPERERKDERAGGPRLAPGKDRGIRGIEQLANALGRDVVEQQSDPRILRSRLLK